MTRIERIDTLLVDVPTIRPHVLSVATMRCQTICLVHLYCSDGSTGIGEATTIGGLAYGEESPEGIKLAIDTYLAPLLIGCDADRPAAAMQALARAVVGNRFAKCALETALLDAFGRRCGLPVSELLGGRVRDRLPVLWTLASGDTGKDIAEAEEMLDRRRHDAFKLKIGKRGVAEDVAHVGAIKRALGARASVRVDVNMAWSEAEAGPAIAMLADVGCDMVEQPIAGTNVAGMARLRTAAAIPIMADEGLTGPASAAAHVAAAACDVFAIKIEQSGGLRAAQQVQAVAHAAGVATYGGTMLEGGVGTVASAHLFATFPRLDFGTELFGPLLLTEEILSEPLDYVDFTLRVPIGPGLGIDLDWAAIERLRRDRTGRVAGAAGGSLAMLYQVTMDVQIPHDADPARIEALKATEKQRCRSLMEAGKWRHIWRVAGRYRNVSIFDVADNAELHGILMDLPLFPFMAIEVTPLCRHPSSIHEDDR